MSNAINWQNECEKYKDLCTHQNQKIDSLRAEMQGLERSNVGLELECKLRADNIKSLVKYYQHYYVQLEVRDNLLTVRDAEISRLAASEGLLLNNVWKLNEKIRLMEKIGDDLEMVMIRLIHDMEAMKLKPVATAVPVELIENLQMLKAENSSLKCMLASEKAAHTRACQAMKEKYTKEADCVVEFFEEELKELTAKFKEAEAKAVKWEKQCKQINSNWEDEKKNREAEKAQLSVKSKLVNKQVEELKNKEAEISELRAQLVNAKSKVAQESTKEEAKLKVELQRLQTLLDEQKIRADEFELMNKTNVKSLEFQQERHNKEKAILREKVKERTSCQRFLNQICEAMDKHGDVMDPEFQHVVLVAAQDCKDLHKKVSDLTESYAAIRQKSVDGQQELEKFVAEHMKLKESHQKVKGLYKAAVEKANEYAEKSNTFMGYCKQYELQIVDLNSKIEKLEWDLNIFRRVGASQNLLDDDSDDETQPILKGTLAKSMGDIFGAAKKKDKGK